MLLFEIAHPAGTLTDADRELLSASIIELFLSGEGHAVETNDRARMATHIAFRELQGWRTGHGTPAPEAAPAMIVTLTVPEAWRAEAGTTFIGLVRTAVKRLDDDRGWERVPASLWVRVDGVADGDIGLDGRPAGAADILEFLTADFRAAQASGTAAPAPPGKLIDPICGMTVFDGKGAIVLEHDGLRVGFCALGCRDDYAHREGIAVPAG